MGPGVHAGLGVRGRVGGWGVTGIKQRELGLSGSHPTVVSVPLTSVDDLLDGFGHLPLEQGVEDFDQEDEAGAEHDEGPGQQNQPHGQVRQRRVREEVLACPTARLGEGLGPARPRSQTCPHQAAPHSPTASPGPPSALCPGLPDPQHPQPYKHPPPDPLTFLPGDVVEDPNAITAAMSRSRAVWRHPYPTGSSLQGAGRLWVSPQHLHQPTALHGGAFRGGSGWPDCPPPSTIARP